jgi:hypothetical protein
MDSLMKLGDFNDIKYPEMVYKYRHFNDPFHLKIITEKQVYFAAPKDFNDPFDCKNFTRYDLLTDKQLLKWYYHTSIETKPNLTPLERTVLASKMVKNSNFKNKKYLKNFQQKEWALLNLRYGILSLTANHRNYRMWEDYGKKHSGFCVGFNPKITFKLFGGGGKVEYFEELPIILPAPFDSYKEQWRKQIYSKLEKWGFEQEYRTQKLYYTPPSNEERTITLPKEALTELILGAEISEPNKKTIIELAQKELPHINIFQAEITKEKGIVIQKI